MELIIAAFFVQISISFFLLWSNKETVSDDRFLTVLLANFLIHVTFSHLVLANANSGIFNRMHEGFYLLYGPLLLFYFRSVANHSLDPGIKLLCSLPCVLAVLFNLLLAMELSAPEKFSFSGAVAVISTAAMVGNIVCAEHIIRNILLKNDKNKAVIFKKRIALVIAMAMFIPLAIVFAGLLVPADNFLFPVQIGLKGYHVWYTGIFFMSALVFHYRLRVWQIVDAGRGSAPVDRKSVAH